MIHNDSHHQGGLVGPWPCLLYFPLPKTLIRSLYCQVAVIGCHPDQSSSYLIWPSKNPYQFVSYECFWLLDISSDLTTMSSGSFHWLHPIGLVFNQNQLYIIDSDWLKYLAHLSSNTSHQPDLIPLIN